MQRKNAWKDYSAEDLTELESFAAEYKNFISLCKTERECASAAIDMAREAGYISMDEARAEGRTLTAGDKV